MKRNEEKQDEDSTGLPVRSANHHQLESISRGADSDDERQLRVGDRLREIFMKSQTVLCAKPVRSAASCRSSGRNRRSVAFET